VKWKQDESGLKVEMPAEKASGLGFSLKIDWA
jgi:hypothetical protein